jgi:hypothetical protein
MNLHAKVVTTMWQWLATEWASALAASMCFGVVLFKSATNEDRQAALRGRKGLVGTTLGRDEDLTPTQQACKSEMWPLFKEAKAAGKCAFWRMVEFFINNIQICLPSSIEGHRDQRDVCVVLWNMHGGGVNKLEIGVQILKLF